MAEYIERDATIQLLKHIGAPTYAVNAVSLVEPIHFFADVEPVAHGRWAFYSSHGEDEYEYKCSVCGDWANQRYPYCPNCGARMEEI